LKNIYIPEPVVIENIIKETPDVKTFTLRLKSREERNGFKFYPGQFIEVSVFGYGEIPVSISSNPDNRENFDITVRAVGYVSNALYLKKEGDEIGIRGPFGNHFPFEEIKEDNILIIGGGIGLAPLRSLILYLLNRKEKSGRCIILYGAKTPEDRLYKRQLSAWREDPAVEFLETVDKADNGWKGNVGVVTTLLSRVKIDPGKTWAFICGPPVMIKSTVNELLRMGLKEEKVIFTLERYMKCGIGKCGHCAIGNKYVCIDGPVFNCKELGNTVPHAIT